MPSTPKKSAPKKTTKGSASQIEETRVATKPLSPDELLNSKGASGTYIVNGFLESDYNSTLAGTAGLAVYDEMRRADAQVRASLMVCMLPLLSTEWFVEPASDEETGEPGEADEEVSDFVSKALFEKMDVSWHHHLTEVLTLLPFGFSVFEKVYRADDDDQFIWLKRLAYRKQTTILKWEQEDGSAGVTQWLPTPIVDETSVNKGKAQISIPASKLLLFSYQKEGDNYAGISVLRSAYKHWYIKDVLYKFDSIKHERQGVGIPVIKLPKGHTELDKTEARAILKNIRANEQGGVLLPNPEWEFMFADLQAGNTSDMWKSIDHHNAMIAKNVLAMFMELASGDGGSRALSEDQSDFFLLSLESLANLIEDVYNRYLIPELVDLNFDVENYPKLKHKKLGSVDYSTISTVMSSLVSAGLLTVDDDLETWVRNMIDAPKKVIQDEELLEEGGEQLLDENGQPIEDTDEPQIDPTTGLPIAPTDQSQVDENGNPVEPQVDENGNPIEDTNGDGVIDELDSADHAQLDDLESQLADVQVTEEDMNAPEDPADELEQAVDDNGNPVDENGDPIDAEDALVKKKKAFDELMTDGEFRMVVSIFSLNEDNFGEALNFRVVSEETKKKISEALKNKLPNKPVVPPKYHRGQPIPEDVKRNISEGLKKALPGDAEATAAKLKAEAATRKSQRLSKAAQKKPTPQRAGQQRMDPHSPISAGKVKAQKQGTGGVINQRRDARLKKAGKKQSSSSLKSGVQSVLSPTGKQPKKQKVAGIASAVKKTKDPAKLKKLKVQVLKMRGKGATHTASPTKQPKSPSKTPTTPTTAVAKTPVGKKVQAVVAARKTQRLAKKKVHAHEEHEEYVKMFGEGAITIMELQRESPLIDMTRPSRQQFAETNQYKTWRPLTFAEQKVNWKTLNKSVSNFQVALDAEINKVTAAQKADLLAQVKRAVEANDIAAVGSIKARYTGDLSAALSGIQKEMFELGKTSASIEMGVKAPTTAREVSGAIKVNVGRMSKKLSDDMEHAAAGSVAEIISKQGGSISSTGTAAAVAAASEAIDKVLEAKAAINTLSLYGSLNLGRASVFERYPEQVYGFQFSAIIDDATTDTCLSLDGRVVKAGSADFYSYSPPRHYNCRSIWVEILQDEEFKPETSDIPSRIPSNPTIDGFEDLIAPIVEDGSPAIKVLQQELDDREAKAKELKDSGLYPNRLAQHESRIDALKKALGN